jgi:deoxyribodipyrimidine photolyase-related protein
MISKPKAASEVSKIPKDVRSRVTVVLPWDLDFTLRSFPKTPRDGYLLVLESQSKPKALPFHRQKMVLILSALQHFAQEARDLGFHVEHRFSNDYAQGVAEFSQWAKPQEIHVTAPREFSIFQRFQQLAVKLPITLHDDGGPGGHFIFERQEFSNWANGRKGQLRMDQFYPLARKKLNLLMDAKGKPLGGQWSFDADNRGHARGVVNIPHIPFVKPDAMTRKVMAFVEQKSLGKFGSLTSFGWPVTRSQALAWLEDFIAHRLPNFGKYEDAIRSDQKFLFHSLLSVPMNLGLLRPEEVARAAHDAFLRGHADLPSTEGFIRQVVGWREFMRGVYWHLMPGLREANQLQSPGRLPDFFWKPEGAQMLCVKEALESVVEHGYAHHIQRLMVLCNYATLAQLNPKDVSHWFWAAFVDAYEWVELPNVVGMGMFGTDAFTSKPYVASAAYIKRQTGMTSATAMRESKAEGPCARCRFKADQRTGENACPLNFLYWDFLSTHRARFQKNPRMATLLSTLDKFSVEERKNIAEQSRDHRAALTSNLNWKIDEEAG